MSEIRKSSCSIGNTSSFIGWFSIVMFQLHPCGYARWIRRRHWCFPPPHGMEDPSWQRASPYKAGFEMINRTFIHLCVKLSRVYMVRGARNIQILSDCIIAFFEAANHIWSTSEFLHEGGVMQKFHGFLPHSSSLIRANRVVMTS